MGKAVHGIGKRCAVENFLVIPTNATLGSVALQATARDGGNMTRSNVMENVTRVVDAPRTWFGPHVSGVDPLIGTTRPCCQIGLLLAFIDTKPAS